MTTGTGPRRRAGLALAAMLLSVHPTIRQSVDPLPILDHATASFDSVQTLAASFVQVITNPLVGAPDTTRGMLFQRRPSYFDSVQTLAAGFVQVISNPLVGAPDTTRGMLFQRRPSYFEMRFTTPRGDRIVADGRHLWLYTPSTTPGQVIRTAIPAAGTAGPITGPNLIGQFVDHARERYQARYVRADTLGPDGPADVIALVPKQSGLPYQSAVIWVARSDALVRRLEITESSGQLRVVMLRRLVVNGTVPDREFRFAVPRGVQVVGQ